MIRMQKENSTFVLFVTNFARHSTKFFIFCPSNYITVLFLALVFTNFITKLCVFLRNYMFFCYFCPSNYINFQILPVILHELHQNARQITSRYYFWHFCMFPSGYIGFLGLFRHKRIKNMIFLPVILHAQKKKRPSYYIRVPVNIHSI